MSRDTPNYGMIMLDALRKWLTDDEVCASVLQGSRPCLRISACQDRLCGLRDKTPSTK